MMIRADNTPQHATQTILGPIQLIFYSVGIIVGAGVYSVIGAAAGLARIICGSASSSAPASRC